MIINFDNIGNTGGGGGGYVLPVATANRLGGIKVGSGLTIDAAGVLSTSGGTAPAGGGDYMVVSGLPQTAQEGQLFFVPEHTENVLYRTYAFDCSAMHQNEVSDTLLPMDGLNGKSVYYEWNNGDYGWFHWDWGENEHDWVEIPGWGFYKVGEGNYTFYAKLLDSIVVDLSNVNQYVSVDSSSTETVQVDVAPATYRHLDGVYRKEVIRIQLDNFKGEEYGFSSNRVFDYLLQFTEAELKQNFVFTYNGNYAVFDNYSDNVFQFKVEASTLAEPVGTPVVYKSYNVNVSYDGGIGKDNDTYYSLPITLTLNTADSGLTTGFWVRTLSNGGTWGGNPIVVKVQNEGETVGWTQNCWFRQAYDGSNQDWVRLIEGDPDCRIFGCEFYMYGDKIVAEWVVNNEGAIVGGAPINWTSTSVHSAADSTIPSSNN